MSKKISWKVYFITFHEIITFPQKVPAQIVAGIHLSHIDQNWRRWNIPATSS